MEILDAYLRRGAIAGPTDLKPAVTLVQTLYPAHADLVSETTTLESFCNFG